MRHSPRPLVAVLMLLVAPACVAAEPPPADKPIVTRRYDASELLKGSRPDDQPDPTLRPLAPDDLIGGTSPSVSESRSNLVKFIRETVDTASWQDVGGWAEVKLERDELVVTQTAENQRLVASMLDQLKPTDASRTMYKFEQARVDKLALDKTPLADAFAQVARAAGLELTANWAALKEAGLEPTSPVTLSAERLRAPVALDAIARAAGMPSEADLWVDFTATSVKVSRDARRVAPNVSMSRLYPIRFLPVRVAGLPAEPKPRRAAVVDALMGRLAKEFPRLKLREVGGYVIATDGEADQHRLAARLRELETAPAK